MARGRACRAARRTKRACDPGQFLGFSLLYLLSYCRKPFQAAFGPDLLHFVISRNLRHVRWQLQPRLHGRRVDMNIRRQTCRAVQRSDANEIDEVGESSCHREIFAPNRDPALRTTSDALTASSGGIQYGVLDVATGDLDTVRLDQSIRSEGSPRLPLAPTAMAAVYDKRCRPHAVSDVTASAASMAGFELGQDPPSRIAYAETMITKTL